MTNRYRVLIALLTILVCLSACGTAPESSQNLDAVAFDDGDDNPAEFESAGENGEGSTPSPPVELGPADYDALRAEIIAERGEKAREEIIGTLRYNASNLAPAFLGGDETAAFLEYYLSGCILLVEGDTGLYSGYVIDCLYFDAAVRNVPYRYVSHGLSEKYKAYDLPSQFYLKEDIDEMAKLLFGEETVIDYSKIPPQQGQYWYHHLSGTASFERVAKEGEAPIVISYVDQGDYYDVTVAFLYWSTWFAEDEYGARVDDEIIRLHGKDAAIDYYLNQSPRYSVRIDKGEDGLLYFKSMDKIG